MPHEHGVIDKDTHFSIDPETMVISCAGTVKSLRRGDMAAERFTFTMPRYIEGHDMALCNKVEAHYNNIHYESSTRETTTNRSFDECSDFGISETDENTVVWTWLIQGDATQLDGTLNFCIRFACMNGAEIEYQKFTEIFEGVPVGETIWNTENVAKQSADVLEEWRLDIMAQYTALEQRVSVLEDTALEQADTITALSDEMNGAISALSDEIASHHSDTAQLDALIAADLLPATYDASGAILTDENGKIILRY